MSTLAANMQTAGKSKELSVKSARLSLLIKHILRKASSTFCAKWIRSHEQNFTSTASIKLNAITVIAGMDDCLHYCYSLDEKSAADEFIRKVLEHRQDFCKAALNQSEHLPSLSGITDMLLESSLHHSPCREYRTLKLDVDIFL